MLAVYILFFRSEFNLYLCLKLIIEIRMKKSFGFLMVITIFIASGILSCQKSDEINKDSFDKELKSLEADFTFTGSGEFEKMITSPLIKTNDCKYIVAGTIEFYKHEELVAVIDFGDGTCDNIATKTIDGNTVEFNLDKTGKDNKGDKYEKVIVEPLVKIEGCDYIVSGVVKFFQGDKWVATIDFGDGACDDLATKTWDGGSKVFSLSKQ